MKQNENVLKEDKKETIVASETPKVEVPKVEKQKNDTNKKENKTNKLMIFGLSILVIIFVILVIIVTATIINMQNKKMYSGISIKGIDVSDLSKDEAKSKIDEFLNQKIPDEIVFKSSNYEATIPSSIL